MPRPSLVTAALLVALFRVPVFATAPASPAPASVPAPAMPFTRSTTRPAPASRLPDQVNFATPRGPVDPHNLVGAISALSAEQLQLGTDVLAELQVGREEKADEMLANYLKSHPDDQKVLLLQALLVRSRPGPAKTAPLFQKVLAANSGTPEGQAARIMLDLEDHHDIHAAFLTLSELHRKNIDSPQIAWLCAMVAFDDQLYAPSQRILLQGFIRPDKHPIMARRLQADINERLDSPLSDMRRMIALREPAPWSYADLAQSLYFSGAYAEANQFAARSLAIDPVYTRAILIWAESLAQQEKFDVADEKCRKAAELEPSNAHTQLVWSQVLYRAGDYPAALAHAKKALQLDSQDESIHTQIGRSLAKLDKPDEALDEYNLATRITHSVPPPHPVVLPLDAILQMKPAQACDEVMKYISAGREKEAFSLADQLLQLYPDQQDVVFLEAIWRFPTITTASQAKTLLARMVKLDPTSPKGRFSAALLKLSADHQDLQSLDALCAIAMEHESDPMYVFAGEIACVQCGHDEPGFEFLRTLSTMFDVGPQIYHHHFAVVLDNLGNHEAALPHRYLSLHIDAGGWNYIGLGITLDSLRYFEDADAAFAKGLTFAEGFSERWYSWGRMLVHWGHYEDALIKLEQALVLDPNNLDTFRSISQCLQSMPNTDETKEHYAHFEAYYEAHGGAGYARTLRAESAVARP